MADIKSFWLTVLFHYAIFTLLQNNIPKYSFSGMIDSCHVAMTNRSVSKTKTRSRKTGSFKLSSPLLQLIADVNRLAREAGLFLNDRELLECGRCGLWEDVETGGMLITYTQGHPVIDSGLRFRKDKRGRYVCPACKAVVEENDDTESR